MEDVLTGWAGNFGAIGWVGGKLAAKRRYGGAADDGASTGWGRCGAIGWVGGKDPPRSGGLEL
ncbi:hypothetical protein ACFWY6_34965, partial [Streptomyces sp. NPDC059037]|uniref:hypothetical protein n=1 Tax=Streptomyces sp. NPDC059037 TaxID=3346710 RepID=UPI00367D5EEE